MMDTYILALKKKDLTFLQMYHHTVIVLLCWSWLEAGWPLHWYPLALRCSSMCFTPTMLPPGSLISSALCRIGVMLNTLVHVFMYYYFSLAALGGTVWWKSVWLPSSMYTISGHFPAR